MDWRAFFAEHRTLLEANYPGLTLERFLREAEEIDGDGQAFLQGVPFAYQLGYCEFAGFNLKVTTDTLIPRPETEQLYERIIEACEKHPQWKRLLDVGTGSGCLGLAIAKTKPQLHATLCDLSPAALKVAETNAFHLGVKATVVESDLLKNVVGLFDLIVSNPPYIPSTSTTVHAGTHQFEPHLALYVNEAQYESFFRRLFDEVARHLTADGMFFMEGHEDRLALCAGWAEAARLTSVSVQSDWAGRPRFLVANAPKAPLG